MFDIHRVELDWGGRKLVLETGKIARQADGAVVASYGESKVLATVVAAKEPKEGIDFLPLTVDYQEKFYAGGRIPGGFFKREGRPTEKETLVSRLIDRPIRPLFPEGFRHEVQVMATVVSMNPDVDADSPALIGASAALMLSGIPFNGPIGAAKVGYTNGKYVLNPTVGQLKDSKLELVVAGTQNAVLMVESEAAMLSEDVMLGAVMFGHREMQAAIGAIKEFAKNAGVRSFQATMAPGPHDAIIAAIKGVIGSRLEQCYTVREKSARREAISALKAEVQEGLKAQAEANLWSPAQIAKEFGELEYSTMRAQVLRDKIRIDGRELATVRPISVRVGVLPRTHGSALFTRG